MCTDLLPITALQYDKHTGGNIYIVDAPADVLLKMGFFDMLLLYIILEILLTPHYNRHIKN